MYCSSMKAITDLTQDEVERIDACLRSLRDQFGDLNIAHVAVHTLAYGEKFINQLAQDVGVSRSVIRRAQQALSGKDIG